MQLLLQCCLDVGCGFGLWFVELGEFMWCVFLNDKFDFVQVEVVVDLIEVSIEVVVCLVGCLFDGVFLWQIYVFVDDVIMLWMLVEVMFDFLEEEIDFFEVVDVCGKFVKICV